MITFKMIDKIKNDKTNKINKIKNKNENKTFNKNSFTKSKIKIIFNI